MSAEHPARDLTNKELMELVRQRGLSNVAPQTSTPAPQPAVPHTALVFKLKALPVLRFLAASNQNENGIA